MEETRKGWDRKDQEKAAAYKEAVAAFMEEMTVEQLKKVYTFAKYLPQAK